MNRVRGAARACSWHTAVRGIYRQRGGDMRKFEKHVLAALGLALLLSVSGWLVLAVLLIIRLECCRP